LARRQGTNCRFDSATNHLNQPRLAGEAEGGAWSFLPADSAPEWFKRHGGVN
jgi:hypothetical protein